MENTENTNKTKNVKMSETRKKANIYFFSKVVFNIFLMILGAVIISLFLSQMQKQVAISKQRENSRQALSDAISILSINSEDAAELTRVFHDCNQDMIIDLAELFRSGVFDVLSTADDKTRSDVFTDLVERSGVDYLLAMSDDGKVLLSPYVEYTGVDLTEYGLLTAENVEKLRNGTRDESGAVDPAMENNTYGYYYFYSTRFSYNGYDFTLVLGTDASKLDVQIAALKDVSVVLRRSTIKNNGFMFAVNTEDQSFLYYENGSEVLTGENALQAGLSRQALEDGYSGVETINGTEYYCVSRTFEGKTVICAVAETASVFSSNHYVLLWSILGFVLVMILCLAYAVIVRNDFVRKKVETDKKIFRRKNGSALIFDKSIFKKVFPLTLAGALLIFGISFYSQTLLEISEGIDSSEVAIEEVSGRYAESLISRDVIQSYYNSRFLSKARLFAYMLEEDPAVLNMETTRYYSEYDEHGQRVFLLDDEENRLKSVSLSSDLQSFCDDNDIESVYLFNEDGHTIATNTENWYFTVSHDPSDQSYVFLDILDGKKDIYIQEPMVNDIGVAAQYIGVAFEYYTTKDADGNTVYASHYDYLTQESGPDGSGSVTTPITEHRGMLQIGLKEELTETLLASTEIDYIFSSNLLSDGFIVVFDNSSDHICLYSPVEASIGKTAAELNVPSNAFTGNDYYGFTNVNSVSYFQFFRYSDGYFAGSAIPRSGMFETRGIVSLITVITSLILILVLSLTVTLTSEEEERLYAEMSDSELEDGLDSKIFNIVLPSGRKITTTKAAARWDNTSIPWNERAPEQKLSLMVSILGAILIIYVAISTAFSRSFFEDGSVIRYILSGNWEKSPNIFAFSACALVLIFTSILVSLIRIPVRIITSILGSRSETIGHLLLSVLKYGGAIGAIFYCLYLLGMDSTSLLASAGVLSLVVGLGAQSLIKDILAGIFIVFEGEFRVGDIVTIGGYRGTVMDIGLRTTKITGVDGNIKIYSNSEISGVLNMTKEASVAACTISIEYGQDLEYVEAVLNRELPLLSERNPDILDVPTYLGVSSLGDSGVELLVVCKCNEIDIKNVIRFLNRELLQIFYRNGINVPFPNITISQLDESSRKTIEDLPKNEKPSETPDEKPAVVPDESVPPLEPDDI